MPRLSSHRPVPIQTEKKQTARIDGNECLERYLRDVRRFAVLSRERERALAKQIQESRSQWQELLLKHLLHVPLLLAWGRAYVRILCASRPSVAQELPPPSLS